MEALSPLVLHTSLICIVLYECVGTTTKSPYHIKLSTQNL